MIAKTLNIRSFVAKTHLSRFMLFFQTTNVPFLPVWGGGRRKGTMSPLFTVFFIAGLLLISTTDILKKVCQCFLTKTAVLLHPDNLHADHHDRLRLMVLLLDRPQSSSCQGHPGGHHPPGHVHHTSIFFLSSKNYSIAVGRLSQPAAALQPGCEETGRV